MKTKTGSGSLRVGIDIKLFTVVDVSRIIRNNDSYT